MLLLYFYTLNFSFRLLRPAKLIHRKKNVKKKCFWAVSDRAKVFHFEKDSALSIKIWTSAARRTISMWILCLHLEFFTRKWYFERPLFSLLKKESQVTNHQWCILHCAKSNSIVKNREFLKKSEIKMKLSICASFQFDSVWSLGRWGSPWNHGVVACTDILGTLKHCLNT
jgi:hypothetical protein